MLQITGKKWRSKKSHFSCCMNLLATPVLRWETWRNLLSVVLGRCSRRTYRGSRTQLLSAAAQFKCVGGNAAQAASG